MDDSYLEWPARYTPVMAPFSKGEDRLAPVFPMSMPKAPFTAFGPIPFGRVYPHSDAVISLGPMPIVPIPRVPMPPVPALTLTPALPPRLGLPALPTTLQRPLMLSRHMSIPFVLQKGQPADYPRLRPPRPSPQPSPSHDLIPPPHIIPPVERYLVPPKPDAGGLFGSGAPGAPKLRSSRSEGTLRLNGMLDVEPITKGPYTSEETPQGPPPAPVFIGRDRSDRMLLPVLAEAPDVEGFARSAMSEPFHADAEYPMKMDGLPRPRHASSTSQSASGRRRSSAGNETSSRRIGSPIIPLDVDITRHPWQKKRQLWQRPEHRFTMFGLISYLTPVKQGGEDIVLPAHLPLGRLNWNILNPPSKATLIFPDGRSKPLGNLELETLAVAPPRKIIYLVYEPLAGDRVMMTIRGTPGSVTVRNVLDDIWGYLQKEYSQKDIKDRLADEPDNQSSLLDPHIHSKDPTFTQRQPLYHFLLDRIFFGGIIYDGDRLSKALGSRYPSEDVWFLQFNDRPQPPPVQ